MKKNLKNKKSLNIAMLGHKRIPSREGGIEIVVEELATRMVTLGHKVTCYNRSGHHVSGKNFDGGKRKAYKGVRLKSVLTLDKKGLAAMTASVSGAICAAFGKYDVVHFHIDEMCTYIDKKDTFDKNISILQFVVHAGKKRKEKLDKTSFDYGFLQKMSNILLDDEDINNLINRIYGILDNVYIETEVTKRVRSVVNKMDEKEEVIRKVRKEVGKQKNIIDKKRKRYPEFLFQRHRSVIPEIVDYKQLILEFDDNFTIKEFYKDKQINVSSRGIIFIPTTFIDYNLGIEWRSVNAFMFNKGKVVKNIIKMSSDLSGILEYRNDIISLDYILFLACYLHDISMVKIPACDSFLLDTDKADELAKTLLDSYNEEFNKANLTKNVQGNDIDILSVKKYMLDSYRKIDNYFEEAVRSKHANDSAAEIRKRSELNYLDTSMRELVAEVSEAHGADERDIYGIKSVASKQLISIKFDKILLRLADLLDMSSYRVSKPILYHNVEQMSEESAFHWISHLLTKGYSLRTEYEITDNAHVLAPKNIIEKLVLEIPVNISQMSALTCGRTCKKVGIDRNRLSQQGIVLVCGQECKDNGNQERNCNFLCKWFCVKNENLIKELAALKEYLNRNKNNYFKSAIEIRIKCNDRTSLDARQFEILNEYIGKM